MLETSINYYGDAPNCDKCHLPLWDDHKSTGVKITCKCTILLPLSPLYGWICPKCGGGCAPEVNRCPCTPFPTFTSPNTNPYWPQINWGSPQITWGNDTVTGSICGCLNHENIDYCNGTCA